MPASTTLAMTHDELLALPVTVDVVTAGRALGIGQSTAYRLAQCGESPVPVLRVGGRYRVALSALLAALGVGRP